MSPSVVQQKAFVRTVSSEQEYDSMHCDILRKAKQEYHSLFAGNRDEGRDNGLGIRNVIARDTFRIPSPLSIPSSLIPISGKQGVVLLFRLPQDVAVHGVVLL